MNSILNNRYSTQPSCYEKKPRKQYASRRKRSTRQGSDSCQSYKYIYRIINSVYICFQIVGWFLVGSFIILSGAVINAGRSFPEYGFGRSYGDSGVVDLNLPFVEVNMKLFIVSIKITSYNTNNQNCSFID